MARTIAPDQLAATVSEILKEYGDECEDILEEVAGSVAKEAASELRGAGRFGGTGKYKRGWKSKVEKTRLKVLAVVYNTKEPGLTHLLEFGHAIKRGGRTVGSADAFEHIKPINDKAQEEALEELERKL